MPSGYTATIKPDTSLNAFVMTCARAFGALVTMRDDSTDAPIPQQFEPSSYYRDEIARRTVEVDSIRAWSDADAAADLSARRQRDEEHAAHSRAERGATKASYERMLALVSDWEPPSADHAALKSFMVEQINESIKFDCSDYKPPVIPEMSAGEWKARALGEAVRALNYASEHWDEEVKRTNERNRWIQQLRDSLATTPAVK